MAEKSNGSKAKTVDLDSKPAFSWVSPDGIEHDRDSNWQLIVVVIAIVLCVVMYWLGSWSGLALVIVATAYLLFTSGHKPKKIECAIYDGGIVVDQKVYNFDDFKAFFLSYGTVPKLSFERIGRFSGIVIMPLIGIENTEEIKAFLDEHPRSKNRVKI